MKVTINGITFSDIFRFGHNDCELAIVFNKDHRYSSMEEIHDLLAKAGISISNFCFKGVSMWDYYLPTGEVNPQLQSLLKEDGETSLLCVIPEYIRKEFQVNCHMD